VPFLRVPGRTPGCSDTLADGGHRLEIVWLAASLNLIELITRIMPDVLGEVS